MFATRLRWREHDALRQPRRPARVRQHGDVVGVGLDLRRLVGVAEQVRERGRALGLAENEHLDAPDSLGRLVRVVEERRHRDEQLRARVLELVGDLVGRVERIHRRRQAPCRRRAVEGDRVLGNVRHVDAEDVAGPETALRQTRREGPDRALELPVGDHAAARAVDQRRLAGALSSILEHVRGHGHRTGSRSRPPAHGRRSSTSLLRLGSLSPGNVYG